MKAGQGNLLRVALGLHCVLHVVWFGSSTPVAEGHGPSAFAEQGSNREVLVDDAVGELSSSTQQAARRMQTTELLDDGCALWQCPVGYTNTIGDCVQPEAGGGRLLIGPFPTDDDWRSDDEYTVVDDDWVQPEDDVTDIPVCSQDICCEPQTCSNGIEGIEGNGVVCCALSCGSCGGNGCTSRPGGAAACCGGGVLSSGIYCDESGSAPCIYGSPPVEETPSPTPAPTETPDTGSTCLNGIEGIDGNGLVCCASSCGSCGGIGCTSRPGGAAACCGGGVLSSGIYCDESGSAPCIYGSPPVEETPSPTPAPTKAPDSGNTCSNGIEGIDANGVVCCSLSCGQCGGNGCSSRPGGAAQCCGGTIKAAGIMCDESGKAPCVI